MTLHLKGCFAGFNKKVSLKLHDKKLRNSRKVFNLIISAR